MSTEILPITFGFIAGITVYIGAIALYMSKGKVSNKGVGFLQAFAGGILGYLGLETGTEAMEYVEELAKPATFVDFLMAAIVTTIAFLTPFLILSYIERGLMRNKDKSSIALYTSFVVALALGVHNVGEGFAIADSLLRGAIASAILFTTGFAIHNATEGFAVVGPAFSDTRRQLTHPIIVGLSMLAGLPTIAGTAVYYAGIESELFSATLNSIATAAIVYAMLHVNLSALSKLGGISSPLFWTALTVGVIITFGTESILLFALP